MTTSEGSPKLTRGAELVLETASRLFYDHGIHAVGVDRVAAESGVTKRTLYDRFGSKETLVLAYLRRREDRWRAVLDRQLDRHPKPGIERILAVFDAAETFHPARSSKGCSAVNARAEEDPDPVGNAVAEEAIVQKAWMRKLFASLCGEAGFAEPEALADRLQILLDGAWSASAPGRSQHR